MARIGIIGSNGRMGHALGVAIAEAGETLAGGIDQGGDPLALARGWTCLSISRRRTRWRPISTRRWRRACPS
jgi:dihydrodipicolinate reductase